MLPVTLPVTLPYIIVAINLPCRIGDYPGQAEVSEMSCSGNYACHWCEKKFKFSISINRNVYGNFRRFLPMNHPWRKTTTSTFSTNELEPEPAARTDASIKARGYAADTYRGPANGHPSHTTAVKRSSPLYDCPLFDMAWDICGDKMHVDKNFIIRTIKFLKGQRQPAKPKLRRAASDTEAKTAEKKRLEFCYDYK